MGQRKCMDQNRLSQTQEKILWYYLLVKQTERPWYGWEWDAMLVVLQGKTWEDHEKIFSSCWEGFWSRTLMESYNEDNRCHSEIFALILEKANSFVWAFLPTSRMSREKIHFFLFTWREEIGETNHTSHWQAPPTIGCLIDSSVSAQTGLVSYLRSALSERSSVHQ